MKYSPHMCIHCNESQNVVLTVGWIGTSGEPWHLARKGILVGHTFQIALWRLASVLYFVA